MQVPLSQLAHNNYYSDILNPNDYPDTLNFTANTYDWNTTGQVVAQLSLPTMLFLAKIYKKYTISHSMYDDESGVYTGQVFNGITSVACKAGESVTLALVFVECHNIKGIAIRNVTAINLLPSIGCLTNIVGRIIMIYFC